MASTERLLSAIALGSLVFWAVPQANADTLRLTNGVIVSGTYAGGDSRTIRFDVEGEIQTYRIDQVIGVGFGLVPMSPIVLPTQPEPMEFAEWANTPIRPDSGARRARSLKGGLLGEVLGCLPTLSAPSTSIGGLPDCAKAKAVATFLQNELPLNLDDTVVYPKVNILPGGPFRPKPLKMTARNIFGPLSPGDYIVDVLAFCTEYSHHRPPQNLPYQLGPILGRNSAAIANLIGRGLLAGKTHSELHGISWAIQSGTTYRDMPQTFGKTIDEIIPEYKEQLDGNFLSKFDARFPLSNQLLESLGSPGRLVASARVQQRILLDRNTSEQIKLQRLYDGQNMEVALARPGKESVWTEMVPGVAYMRLKVLRGHWGMNTLELRILPAQPPKLAILPGGAYLTNVAAITAAPPPSLWRLMGGTVNLEALEAVALRLAPAIGVYWDIKPQSADRVRFGFGLPEYNLVNDYSLQKDLPLLFNALCSDLRPDSAYLMDESCEEALTQLPINRLSDFLLRWDNYVPRGKLTPKMLHIAESLGVAVVEGNHSVRLTVSERPWELDCQKLVALNNQFQNPAVLEPHLGAPNPQE